MDLKIDGFADVRPQGHHCRIKTFEMSDLKNRIPAFCGFDHAIGFFERSRDWLFNEHVNAGLEETTSDLTMCFSRDRYARSIDTPDQFAPVGGPVSLSFPADRARGFLVQIANRNEFRCAFGGEISMNARVLLTETANSDHCCA